MYMRSVSINIPPLWGSELQCFCQTFCAKPPPVAILLQSFFLSRIIKPFFVGITAASDLLIHSSNSQIDGYDRVQGHNRDKETGEV